MSWKVEVCIQKSLVFGAAHHDHRKLDFSTLLFLHLYYFAKANENSDPVLNMIHCQKRNIIALFSYQMGFKNEKNLICRTQLNKYKKHSYRLYFLWKKGPQQTNKQTYFQKQNIKTIFLETSPFSRSLNNDSTNNM